MIIPSEIKVFYFGKLQNAPFDIKELVAPPVRCIRLEDVDQEQLKLKEGQLAHFGDDCDKCREHDELEERNEWYKEIEGIATPLELDYDTFLNLEKAPNRNAELDGEEEYKRLEKGGRKAREAAARRKIKTTRDLP